MEKIGHAEYTRAAVPSTLGGNLRRRSRTLAAVRTRARVRAIDGKIFTHDGNFIQLSFAHLLAPVGAVNVHVNVHASTTISVRLGHAATCVATRTRAPPASAGCLLRNAESRPARVPPCY